MSLLFSWIQEVFSPQAAHQISHRQVPFRSHPGKFHSDLTQASSNQISHRQVPLRSHTGMFLIWPPSTNNKLAEISQIWSFFKQIKLNSISCELLNQMIVWFEMQTMVRFANQTVLLVKSAHSNHSTSRYPYNLYPDDHNIYPGHFDKVTTLPVPKVVKLSRFHCSIFNDNSLLGITFSLQVRNHTNVSSVCGPLFPVECWRRTSEHILGWNPINAWSATAPSQQMAHSNDICQHTVR